MTNTPLHDQCSSLPCQAAQIVKDALVWARERYGAAKRSDGRTVLQHAEDVAQHALTFAPGDSTLLLAALLHDLLETTNTTRQEIAQRFGEQVTQLVEAVTNPPDEQARDSAARAVAAGSQAVLLRLLDRYAGLQYAAHRPLPARRRYLTDTRKVYLPLAEQYCPALATAIRRELMELDPTADLPPS